MPTIALREYQQDVENEIYNEWSDGEKNNVLAVLPTGAGKTVLFAKILKDSKTACVAIAHRQELVSQISIALARNGVQHRIIAPTKLIKTIVTSHMRELGQSFYNPSSKCAVAGVDTLVRRYGQLSQWMQTVGLWVQDEAHHVLEANKWGKAASMFPNAKGLGVTATPCRADGAGLGRHNDGLFDTMIEGPSLRDLIRMGFLTEYKIYAPPSNLDLSQVAISKTTGDRNINQLRAATEKSSLVVAGDDKNRVVGDIVEHYLKIAPGKLGITFVPSVEIAKKVSDQFNASGVPSAVVSAKTPDEERARLLNDFRERRLLQLINVDLFGEGFDLPAIEVVSMARRTESFSLFVQQAGRALRIMDGKEHAIIIDHVGNVERHGTLIKEDGRYIMDLCCREWTLDRREKKSNSLDEDVIPTRTCLNDLCFQIYDRSLLACPYCQTPPPLPAARNDAKFVDGDLFELDQETLARMYGDINEIDRPLQDQLQDYRRELQNKRTPKQWEWKHVNDKALKIELQQTTLSGLREVMAWWAGYHRNDGRTDREIFKLFYLRFGIDWLSAFSLSTDEMMKLSEKVLINTGY